MALSPRSASRFFAAFYRWNRCAGRIRYATTITQNFHDRATCPVLAAKRQYHSSVSRRQQVTTEGDAVHGTSQEPSEEPAEEPESDLKRTSREIFRMAPSSVAVITVASEDPDTGNPLPMGVAVSSLTSVTLDPPTISFNIKTPSQTLDAIHAARGVISVHFLKADAKGAQIVDLFSRGNHADAYKTRTDNLKIAMPRKLEGTYSFPPQILDHAVAALMNCTVTHELTVADHAIIAARVDSVQHMKDLRPLLAYADGRYRGVTSPMTPYSFLEKMESSNTEVLSRDEHMGSGWSVWDMPLTPDIQDRQKYVNHFKSIVRQFPEGLELTQVEDNLRKLTSYPPYLVGIEWRALVDNYIRDACQADGPATYDPSLARYYGRLSASERQALVTEVVDAVRGDPDLQCLAYPDFLRHFGINLGVIGLLPSDLMGPIREAGLDTSQKLSEKDLRNLLLTKRHCTLPMAEQVEGLLRNHIGALSFEQANESRKRYGFGLKIIEQVKNLHDYFSKSGSRLVAECHPSHFAEEYIDIKGDLTHEEIRVVLARIIRFVWAEGIQEFKKRLNMDPHDLLYLNGIHPSVTGLNIELLFAKLLHIHRSAAFSIGLKHFETYLMLEPYFDMFIKNIKLRRSIRRFIDHPRANTSNWTKEDKLAAIGVHWGTKTSRLHKGRTVKKDMFGTTDMFVPVMDIEEIDALFDGVDAEAQVGHFDAGDKSTASEANVHGWLEEHKYSAAIAHDNRKFENYTEDKVEAKSGYMSGKVVDNKPEQKVEEKSEDKPEDKLEDRTEDRPEKQIEDALETKLEEEKVEGQFTASDANVHAWLDEHESSAAVTHHNREVEDYIEDKVKAKPRYMTGDVVENKPGQKVEEKSKDKPEDIAEYMTRYETEDWAYSTPQRRPASNKQSEPTNWLTFSLLKRKNNR